MKKISDDFLPELKELLEYALDQRDFRTVEEVYEMICEELGEDPIATEEEVDYDT